MLQRFLGLPALVLVWVLSLSVSFYFACCTSVPVNLVGHDAPGFTFLITIMITLHGWANQSKPYMIDMTSNNILIMIRSTNIEVLPHGANPMILFYVEDD